MAFTKIGDWTDPVVNEPDRPNRTASEMKAVFDANSNQIREAFNTLCDDVQDGLDGLRGCVERGEVNVAFTEAAERAPIESGEPLAAICGKLRKLGTDAELAIATVKRDGAYPLRYLSMDGTYTVPAAGAAANGVAAGGTAGQAYVKASGADYDGVWGTLTPEVCGAAPERHASRHAAGGADPVTPADIGAAAAAHAAAHASGGADAITPASIGAMSNAAAAAAVTNRDQTYTVADAFDCWWIKIGNICMANVSFRTSGAASATWAAYPVAYGFPPPLVQGQWHQCVDDKFERVAMVGIDAYGSMLMGSRQYGIQNHQFVNVQLVYVTAS